MMDTQTGKDVGLAGRALGLFIGGAFALAGLVTLFASLMNLSGGNLGTGVLAGALSVALGGYGADRIFRDADGPHAFCPRRLAVAIKNRPADPANCLRRAVVGHNEIADPQRLDQHLASRRPQARAGKQALV